MRWRVEGLSYAKVVCKWPHDFGKVWYKVVHLYTKLFLFEEWLPVSSWSKTLAWGLQAIHIDTCNWKDFQYVGWMWQLNGHLSPCAEVDCFNRWDANSVRDFRGWTRQSAMVQRDAATVMVYLFGTTWQDLTSRGNKRKFWNYIYIYIEYISTYIYYLFHFKYCKRLQLNTI